MTLIWRLIMIAAAPIAALFVSQDALNFGLMQTLIAIILIAVASLLAALWTLRSQDESRTAAGNEAGTPES
ncbi:MAG: hypothetical protein PS018_28760 [bacterium]|nr:hypothetical protein [bacterium]